jgi:hypothetical protein
LEIARIEKEKNVIAIKMADQEARLLTMQAKLINSGLIPSTSTQTQAQDQAQDQAKVQDQPAGLLQTSPQLGKGILHSSWSVFLSLLEESIETALRF